MRAGDTAVFRPVADDLYLQGGPDPGTIVRVDELVERGHARIRYGTNYQLTAIVLSASLHPRYWERRS